MNNPALNWPRDIHLCQSTTTREMGIPLSFTTLAVKEKRDRLTGIRTKGRLSLETMKIDGTGIKAESN